MQDTLDLVIQRQRMVQEGVCYLRNQLPRQIPEPETPVMIEVLGCPCAQYVCYLSFQMENWVPCYITN